MQKRVDKYKKIKEDQEKLLGELKTINNIFAEEVAKTTASLNRYQQENKDLKNILSDYQDIENILITGQMITTLEKLIDEELRPKDGSFTFREISHNITQESRDTFLNVVKILGWDNSRLKKLVNFACQVKDVRIPKAHPTNTFKGIKINEKIAQETLNQKPAGITSPKWSVIDAIKALHGEFVILGSKK